MTHDCAVTSFSADWLALREPADTRARDANLTALLVRFTQSAQFASTAQIAQTAQTAHPCPPPRFLDLACGTGSNLRYLASRVGSDQQWLLVDHDATLLSQIGSGPSRRVETRQLNLATDLQFLEFTPDTIVTASALLDLVSDRWLVQLVDRCRTSRCAALFALSYDGRVIFTPSDPDDEWIRQLVNRHQLGDKGFGPALGPGAGQRTSELFRDVGYQVHTAQSEWNLLPEERLLQQCLLGGWAAAASDLAPNEADRCRAWLVRRLEHVANGISRIIVGHEDVLALPRE